MKNNFGLLIVIALFAALGCRSQQPTTLNIWEGRDMNVINEVFRGMLPCADCKKTDFRLSLNTDMTWQSHTLYIGKTDKALNESGRYNVTEDGVLILHKNDEVVKRLRIIPRGLLMLDSEGKEITGSMADKYILIPISKGK